MDDKSNRELVKSIFITLAMVILFSIIGFNLWKIYTDTQTEERRAHYSAFFLSDAAVEHIVEKYYHSDFSFASESSPACNSRDLIFSDRQGVNFTVRMVIDTKYADATPEQIAEYKTLDPTKREISMASDYTQNKWKQTEKTAMGVSYDQSDDVWAHQISETYRKWLEILPSTKGNLYGDKWCFADLSYCSIDLLTQSGGQNCRVGGVSLFADGSLQYEINGASPSTEIFAAPVNLSAVKKQIKRDVGEIEATDGER